MAEGESGSNNVAIVALIVIAVLIAGAAILYYQGGFGKQTVIQHDTVVEQPAAPAPAPAEPKAQDQGFSVEHQDSEGNKTEIHTPPPE